jgi:hypothetical protein
LFNYVKDWKSLLNLGKQTWKFHQIFAAFCSLSSTPFKRDKINGNFCYGLYRNFALKFKRFFELNLSVKSKFCTILSHSWTKYFALHEYRSYLPGTIFITLLLIGPIGNLWRNSSNVKCEYSTRGRIFTYVRPSYE